MRRQRLVAKLLKKFPHFLLSSWTAVDVNETRPYIREPVVTGAKKWERNYQQKVSYIDRSRERCAGTTWRLLGRKTLIRIGCRRGGHGLLASKHSGYSTSFLFKPFFFGQLGGQCSTDDCRKRSNVATFRHSPRSRNWMNWIWATVTKRCWKVTKIMRRQKKWRSNNNTLTCNEIFVIVLLLSSR